MEEKMYLHFDEAGHSASGKTRIWNVRGASVCDRLGVIKWYGPWRRYVFWPDADTLYDASCLKEIAAFIERGWRHDA